MKRKIFYDEIEVYPEPFLCAEDKASYSVEVTDEEFQRITRAWAAWRDVRGIFFNRGKQIKRK